MNILKGIGAVIAGVIFIVGTHSLTDFILESLGIFTPPDAGFHATWMLVTATIYRSIFSIGGGYLTAALAPEPKMRYVLVLAAIGLIAGALAAIFTIPMNLSPAWYPIALAVTGPICVWIGGKIRMKKVEKV
jgi:uncharacterized membrane protein